MTAEVNADGAARAKTRKTILSMIGGGILGFVGASLLLFVVGSGKLGDPDGSSVAALLVGLVYGLTGLIVVVGVASPQAGAKFLNVEDADELLEEKSTLAASGWGMIVMGLALAVIALAGDGGLVAPLPALGVFVVLMGAGTVLSIRSMRQADELMRALTAEATQLSYYMLFFVMGSWAGLAHLRLVSAPAMLDLLTAFWALMLIATFWVAGRRGLLATR